MIDRTNDAIGELEIENRREMERRYTFQRMLRTTDLLLWRLEEMNRDGLSEVPTTLRVEIRQALEELPSHCRDVHRERVDVQGALDNIFEVQESLFRWRHPEWAGDDEEKVAS